MNTIIFKKQNATPLGYANNDICMCVSVYLTYSQFFIEVLYISKFYGVIL